MNTSASIFRRAALGFVAARERQAQNAVAPYLLSLADDELAVLGHDRETVKSWVRRPSTKL